MDVFTHGLWGGIAFGRKYYFIPAVTFGVLPDVLAFGPFLAVTALTRGTEYLSGRPDPAIIPDWVYLVYNTTHSLVVAGLLFLVIWLYFRKYALAFLAWPLHILFDIPTHTADYFPTKFLFPLSTIYFDGISWATPLILLPNYLLLAGLYAYFLFHRRKIRR